MKSRISAAVLACLALSGCLQEDIGHRQRLPVPPARNWEVVGYSGGTCECRDAKQYFLVNRTASTASTSVIEYRNVVDGNGHEEITHRFSDVRPGETGRKLLGCSPANSATYQCGVDHQWEVDGYLYDRNGGRPVKALRKNGALVAGLTAALANDQLSSADRRDLLRLRSVAVGGKAVTARQDCASACKAGSADCLRASLADGGSDPTPKFVSLVQQQGKEGYVAADKLLEALGQRENPCERSGLSIRNGRLSNSGYDCSWTGAKGTAFEVEARIPALLAGRFSQPKGRLLVEFERPEVYGPSLHFANGALDEAYGGAISRIEQTSFVSGGQEQSFVVMTGPERCVALKAGQ